ncbi:MAG: F0F1 ATP synthase subunit B [Acidimicrobiales bacterium]
MIASSNFLVPNTTFVVELVAFLGVLGVLAKWVLPYVNRAVEERQRTIERSLSEAAQARERAQRAEEEARQAIEQARAEARSLRDEAAKLGEQARQELRQQGEEEYRRLVSRAASDIDASVRRAGDQLRAQVAELVMAAVERVLGEGLTLANQEQLVEQALAELEAEMAANPGGLPQAEGTAKVGP